PAAPRSAAGARHQVRLAADVGQSAPHAEASGEGGGAELVSPHVYVDAPAEGDLRVGDHRERGVLVRVDVLDEGVPLDRVAGRHRAALRVLRPGGGDGAGDGLLPALTLLDDVEAAAVVRAQRGAVREVQVEPVPGGRGAVLEGDERADGPLHRGLHGEVHGGRGPRVDDGTAARPDSVHVLGAGQAQGEPVTVGAADLHGAV